MSDKTGMNVLDIKCTILSIKYLQIEFEYYNGDFLLSEAFVYNSVSNSSRSLRNNIGSKQVDSALLVLNSC